MKINPLPVRSLDPGQISAWSDLLERNMALLGSPYLRPEFTLAVAHVRDHVEVAVFEKDGQPQAFLPFERGPWYQGNPVGGTLCNFQAIIGPESLAVEPVELVRQCGLLSLRFNQLLAAVPRYCPYVWQYAESPYIDLADGFDAYIAQRPSRKKLLQETERKSRKMGREIGPVSFAVHEPDETIVDCLIRWKSEQHRAAQVRDVFRQSWVRRLLNEILAFDLPAFCPMVSTLRAGDRLVAISYALRSNSSLHGWHIAYDPELSAYSPGMQLLLELIRGAAAEGIRRFDLGQGSGGFKERLSSGVTTIAQGSLDLHQATAAMRRTLWRTRAWILSSPLGNTARLPVRMLDQIRGWID